MSQKILVTGGLGFIGSHTVVELCSAGYEPIIIDDLSNSNIQVLDRLTSINGSKPIFYQADFTDHKVLDQIFSDHTITGVIHFAAFKAVNESLTKPLAYYQNNVSGLISLLQTMEQHSVNNLVFSSSCTVYGEPDSLPITESAPFKPATSPYGASKQMCEQIIKDTCHANPNLKALSLRYFNPIGAHPSGLIGELPIGVPANLMPFITQAAAGLRDQLTINGNDYPTADGTCVRDYIHVVDLAKAHVKALSVLTKEKSFYDAINVGTGKGTSVLEAINTFESVNNVKVPYRFGPRRDGDIENIYADVAKSEEILGWKAERTIADALKDAWNWQQKLAQQG
jgi:UDP-glucose 4-epimerase